MLLLGKKELTPDASNFALHFLHALRNGDGEDHILTFDELVAELKNTTPTPHISTFEGHQEGSNFLFIKNIDASSPLQKLEADMVRISGGTFIMGSLYKMGKGFNDPKPPHEVRIQDFFIGKYEVTQAQWRAVMGSDSPMLHNKNCDECPVEGVSWEDTQDFIDKLNALTNKRYRLPTEAEWEYAARGGNQSQGYLYSGNNNLFRVAWYGHNYEQNDMYGTKKTTHPVGQKKPNELGLYDMSGNVWEWVEDCWHNDYIGAPVDGSAWIDGAVEIARVYRGGGWAHSAEACISTTRNLGFVTYKSDYLGFRLAL